ncbi:hypothetical protein B0A50_08300 [Salinomyces thailandicus]|uniref:Uncharacterized protein n=1 Tax=Salinomyces thailandicus TaxID=706561 RepID=A0A4U0TL21_9PEZI|nr:hypothetical protein B0A50_08300 [Salinomyces thailandica]
MNPIFCIPQAIDSRSKVLVAGNDVHKKGAGATELNSVVESLVKDLKDASSKSETPDAATSGIPGDDQRAHVELGKEIRELASKPLRVLEKFRRDGTAKFRTWEAIRNGAKAVWYADLIEAAERRSPTQSTQTHADILFPSLLSLTQYLSSCSPLALLSKNANTTTINPGTARGIRFHLHTSISHMAAVAYSVSRRNIHQSHPERISR